MGQINRATLEIEIEHEIRYNFNGALITQQCYGNNRYICIHINTIIYVHIYNIMHLCGSDCVSGVWQMGLMCPFSLRLAALFVFVPAIKLDKQN